MPTYTTHCQNCGDSGDLRLSFIDYDDIQRGDKKLVCNQCDHSCEILFDPSSVQFVMKDGETGSFPSKAVKENKYRARRRQVMAKREQDHVFKPKLQANYQGIETGTWKDAREFARVETAKEHGQLAATVVAQTYDPLVEKGS
jgi:hypothetical protein